MISALNLVDVAKGGGVDVGKWWKLVLREEQQPWRKTSAAAESASPAKKIATF